MRLGLCEVGNTYTVIDECIGWGKDNTPVDCYVLDETIMHLIKGTFRL